MKVKVVCVLPELLHIFSKFVSLSLTSSEDGSRQDYGSSTFSSGESHWPNSTSLRNMSREYAKSWRRDQICGWVARDSLYRSHQEKNSGSDGAWDWRWGNKFSKTFQKEKTNQEEAKTWIHGLIIDIAQFLCVILLPDTSRQRVKCNLCELWIEKYEMRQHKMGHQTNVTTSSSFRPSRRAKKKCHQMSDFEYYWLKNKCTSANFIFLGAQAFLSI